MERRLTGALESLDVLWALSQLSDGLNESDTGLLVGLEWGKHCTGHSLKEVCVSLKKLFIT